MVWWPGTAVLSSRTYASAGFIAICWLFYRGYLASTHNVRSVTWFKRCDLSLQTLAGPFSSYSTLYGVVMALEYFVEN